MSDQFEALLAECTFRVRTATTHGTAFAIQSDLLLTCRHVVDHLAVGETVTVLTAGDSTIQTKVEAKFPPDSAGTSQNTDKWPDIALLRVDADADPDLTATLLTYDRPARDDTLTVAGYPFPAVVPYATRDYTTKSKYNIDPSGHRYTLITGESIDPGCNCVSGDDIKQDPAEAFDQSMRPLEPDADLENLMDAVLVDRLQNPSRGQ